MRTSSQEIRNMQLSPLVNVQNICVVLWRAGPPHHHTRRAGTRSKATSRPPPRGKQQFRQPYGSLPATAMNLRTRSATITTSSASATYSSGSDSSSTLCTRAPAPRPAVAATVAGAVAVAVGAGVGAAPASPLDSSAPDSLDFSVPRIAGPCQPPGVMCCI
jgi:hypothetical protein